MAHEKHTLDIIQKSWNYFDYFNIVDGNLNEDFVKTFDDYVRSMDKFSEEQCDVITDRDLHGNRIYHISKLNLIDRKWDDNFVRQYLTALNYSEKGDWLLHLDSDEFPSQILLDNLENIIHESGDGMSYDIVTLPVVDFLNEEKLWEDAEVPQTYKQGMWTKHILIKRWDNTIKLHYAGDEERNCHAIPLGKKYVYKPYPYYHFRTTEDFVKNELWEMFLTPEGQRLSPVECARFKTGCKVEGIKTSREFMQKIQKGIIGPILEKIAFEYRDKFIGPNNDLHPFCQLYAYYYCFCNNDKENPDPKFDKQFYTTYVEKWKRSNPTYR